MSFGVFLFFADNIRFKNSLPIKIRNVLTFEESIVVELNFGRIFYIFTVIYRSPAFSYPSPEFLDRLSNFFNLCSNIKNENPHASFFTGDFNGHSQFWWSDGDTTPKGRENENPLSSLTLSNSFLNQQILSRTETPCINLMITGQPNLVLDRGTRASLDSFWHHQITYCKVSFNIPPPPPLERKIWHYHRANTTLLKRSMCSFIDFSTLILTKILIGKLKHLPIFFLDIMKILSQMRLKELFLVIHPGYRNP